MHEHYEDDMLYVSITHTCSLMSLNAYAGHVCVACIVQAAEHRGLTSALWKQKRMLPWCRLLALRAPCQRLCSALISTAYVSTVASNRHSVPRVALAVSYEGSLPLIE